MSDLWPWLALALLGAYHGINPAMGWLFAVARGLQERRRSAVVESLLPIALGHELAVAVIILIVSVAQHAISADALRIAGAVALIAFGIYKFARPRSHPKWVGMRVTTRDLVVWSFLMSSAHGAGLMLFPVLLGLTPTADSHAAPEATVLGFSALGLAQDLAALMLHTVAMLLAMGAVALIVYDKVGLAILRKAWVNLDMIWAGAVVVAGVFTLFT